uniref:Uncharacterized protein n=1 Tax=viral metagenome TaxID=1070528 RepID=A0A6C0KIN3_9ZZZZ
MASTIITQLQSYVRRYLANKNNIFKCFKQDIIQDKFKNEIMGYHIINDAPIKEAVWEEINKNIVKDVCEISDEAQGNHLSGKDNKFNNWNISNKTAKMNKNKIDISSYRLTKVCSNKSPGIPKDFIDEIEKRDNSFEYYSILLREERKNKNIHYIWCIIPKDYYIFNAKCYEWKRKFGKMKKNKDIQVGWESKYMNITFAMSSQLWFHFNYHDIKKYIIAEVEVNANQLPRLSYSEIYKLHVPNADINDLSDNMISLNI